MHDLESFGLSEMNDLVATVRRIAEGARSMEEVATRAVRLLYDGLGDGGQRACALVRMYKTHRYADLEPAQQAFVQRLLAESAPDANLPCLMLLGTAGDEPDWNDRRASRGHVAIPLPSEEMVNQLPMVAELVRQMGVDVRFLVNPTGSSILLEVERRSYNVFHVPEALGSPYIPAQDGFVRPHAIRSVLGFGGVLPFGSLFAIVMFSRAPVSRNVAEAFKPVSVGLKVALVPFAAGPIFAPPGEESR